MPGVTAFTVSELLKLNQQGVKITPTPLPDYSVQTSLENSVQTLRKVLGSCY